MAATWKRLRTRAGTKLIQALFEGYAGIGRLHPGSSPGRWGIRVDRDLAYGSDPLQRLDVWRREDLGPEAPAVMLVHGGGFSILSKDTHHLMALRFAQAGYVVLAVDYRLVPRDPFPAALEDVCAAYRWALDRATELRFDPSRLALAGESAGANLLLALSIATCFERPEPYAREVFDRGVVPAAMLPLCGMLQVSEPERYAEKKRVSTFHGDRIRAVAMGYLGAAGTEPKPDTELADPLRILEGEAEPARALPPTYTAVGTEDPIEDDTHRLAAALARRGVPHRIEVFTGEFHAFHFFTYRAAAKACWDAQLAFLAEHVGGRNGGS